MSYLELGQWYVVYAKPHREEVAQGHLQRKGVEVFFPRLLLPYPLPKHRQIVPLFPRYLFVRLQVLEEYDYVRWSPGVRSVVSFNGTPAPLAEETVAFLRRQATPEGLLTGPSPFRVGQEVRLTGGPLAGLVGILQDPPDARGRVRVLLQLLSRRVGVDVALQWVEGG